MRWIELGSDWAICLENFFCEWVLQLQEVVGLGQLNQAGAHGPIFRRARSQVVQIRLRKSKSCMSWSSSGF